MKLMKPQFSTCLGTACLLAFLPISAPGQDAKTAPTNGVNTNLLSHLLAAREAGPAWDELQEAAAHPPSPPDEWQLKEPSPDEEARFFLPSALILADKAVDFYSRFPADTNAIAAKLMEFGIITWAVDHGATNQATRFDAVEKAVLADPKLSEDERFEIRDNAVRRAVNAREPEGDMAMLAEFEKGARMIEKEFPKRPDFFVMLLQVAENSDPDKSRALLKEIATNDPPAELKDAAADMQKQLDRVGTALTLKFTAVDGRQVDVAKMQGKVVLLNFWATGSEASVDLLPEIKESYDKRHGKGLEIVGINMDENKESLTNFVAAQQIAWPQFFDALNAPTNYAAQFGVKGEDLPAAWLVDKKGVLRYINAGFDMNRKIDALLAE